MQTFKNTRSDHLLAAALMIGALVLAVVSWQIPNLFFAPMTADMRGIVETVEPAYENTRMAIRLEGNSTRYTIMLEDYATLTQTPQVGDEVGIKYDITSDRLIRMPVSYTHLPLGGPGTLCQGGQVVTHTDSSFAAQNSVPISRPSSRVYRFSQEAPLMM